ncbi:hypothetical protein FA95DRAFT_1561606 [Auriscalpium vulgare]|uniref:Uncharacterized protein n=1 Tax=Auriscalpium vulgare TaxID=40419 RepID=A0ACB8RM50_9AGAM|nr:hypothetical protein FA95DRAFT_1561606 [Auriscalpium vulgare]
MKFSLSFFSSACVVASLFLSVSASPNPHAHARHAAHAKRVSVRKVADEPSVNGTLLVEPPARRRRGNSKRCVRKTKGLSSSAPQSTSPSTLAAKGTPAASSSPAPHSSSTPTKSTTPTLGGGAAQNAGGAGAGKPAFWPTKTQAAATYSATAASAADPMLLSVSDALNNKGNALFTEEHTGDLTFYGQGLGACGDTYDDSTYTAALSHFTYDAWPGATEETNRNAICGPFTPGRLVINDLGTFDQKVSSPAGAITIGGDGLPNCSGTDPNVRCHIPLTVTITNPENGKSVVAKIVE